MTSDDKGGASPSGRAAGLRPQPPAASSRSSIPDAGPFYIVDVRKQWSRNPYITVWRPDNAGYAYPLSWAGKYDRATVDANPGYYHLSRYGTKRALDRFPVPCAAVEALAIAPAPGIIDGNAGPVIPNLAPIRAALRKARYVPPSSGGQHDL